ncbi:MAG: DUF998 domain-containing protein [Gemmatimonadaceae bacterium]|jgi:hypothetical protein|nr:DUF998 domain-containing protein [Gemmatimonadaceae bacterium]
MSERAQQVTILLLLVASAVAFLMAPTAIAPSYSWVRHSISESAAQGLVGAWVARSGFLLFGSAVLWLAAALRPRWHRRGSVALGTFGAMMLGTAAYSHRPWLPGVPFDAAEDLLHSATASIMGVAFATGVVLVGAGRRNASRLDRTVDALALVASMAIPLGMSQWTAYTGLLQRSMFLIAYIWYGRETIRWRR